MDPHLAGSQHSANRQDVHLILLKGFELQGETRPIDLPMTAKRLLAFLALGNRPLARNYVAEALWLDKPGLRPSANLRSTLWRIRREGRGLIRGTNDDLRLSSHVTVDFNKYLNLAYQLLGMSNEDPPSANDRELISGFSAELLPGWYDEWLTFERERWNSIRVQALETMAKHLAAKGRFAPAGEAAIAASLVEPLRESAHQLLIRIHLAQGNRGLAIAQYRRYRSILRTELNLEPSAELDKMVRKL
jgi:DNA-binding SARP family transcriptional activator